MHVPKLMMDAQRFTYNRLKVSFDPNVKVFNMFVWSYAYHTARIGTWNENYLDRMRFNQRIQSTEKIISPILMAEHRMKLLSVISGINKTI